MAPFRYLALVGFVILIVGVFCPLVSPLGILSWNLFDLNKIFAVVIVVISFTGIAAALLEKTTLVKFIGFINLALVILIFAAAVIKINTSFSFIPFPKIAHYFSTQLHYRWGWFLLFGGAILAVLSSLGTRKSLHTPTK